MVDRFGRPITYLRISVTDRCNLRCQYCVPTGEARFARSEDVLSFGEIAEVAHVAAGLGVTKLRITGGEPLVRAGIAVLVEKLAAIPGIEDLAMSTNGTLLAAHTEALAAAGLQRVNVSLDAMRPERYAALTGGGDVRDVLAGIEAAGRAGLTPIKLNCVVTESSSEPDAQDVAAFARREGLTVRFIRRMDLSAGTFAVVEGGSGGDCRRCGRLRLSCDGTVRPCLFSDLGFSIRRHGPAWALRQAIDRKPEAGGRCTQSAMYAIGG